MTQPTTHWGKLYGSLCLHPKWLATPAEGRALWTSALSYCIVIGSDGEVPEGVLHMLNAPGTDVATGVDQLLEHGLWTRSEKGYKFHDWEDHQQTVEERKAKQEKASRAGKASAAARRKAKSEEEANSRSTDVEGPVEQSFNETATEKRREEKRREGVATTSAPADANDPPRPEITDLCNRLADRIEGNGVRRPAITRTWQDAARRLIDLDGYTPDEITRVIDWCQADDFWKTNILSMPTLRKKFPQLKLKAENTRPRPQAIPSGRPTEGSWMIPRKAS